MERAKPSAQYSSKPSSRQARLSFRADVEGEYTQYPILAWVRAFQSQLKVENISCEIEYIDEKGAVPDQDSIRQNTTDFLAVYTHRYHLNPPESLKTLVEVQRDLTEIRWRFWLLWLEQGHKNFVQGFNSWHELFGTAASGKRFHRVNENSSWHDEIYASVSKIAKHDDCTRHDHEAKYCPWPAQNKAQAAAPTNNPRLRRFFSSIVDIYVERFQQFLGR